MLFVLYLYKKRKFISILSIKNQKLSILNRIRKWHLPLLYIKCNISNICFDIENFVCKLNDSNILFDLDICIQQWCCGLAIVACNCMMRCTITTFWKCQRVLWCNYSIFKRLGAYMCTLYTDKRFHLLLLYFCQTAAWKWQHCHYIILCGVWCVTPYFDRRV